MKTTEVSTIRSLRPNVTREQALQLLHSDGARRLLRSVRLGSLRSIAAVYVPFRLYSVEVMNNGRRDHSLFAVDAVSGQLDLYRFDHLPNEADLISVRTRNYASPLLDEAAARAVLSDKVLRLLFLTGFFKMRTLSIRPEPVPLDFCVPYWVGFFGSGNRARISVVDAVRRKPEGARVRQLIYSWLANSQ